MAPDVRLVCRACGRETAPGGVQYCAQCFGPLDLIDGGLPPEVEPTPLVPLPGLGFDDLWAKDETADPTGSFKDRLVAAARARAVEVGFDVLACSSTGNLARAVAWGAKGLQPIVVVPDRLAPDEQEALAHLGATVVAVRGDYDATNRLATEAAEAIDGWGWVNGNLRPWYALGAVGLADELDHPAQVVLPMASGALAFQVSRRLGATTRLVVGQPSGCAPVAVAWAAGEEEVAPVRPDTRVELLAMGDPPDGSDVLAAARASGGAVLAVDEDGLDGWAAVVEDAAGIVVDLASAVAVGAAVEAVERRILDPAVRTVVVLTGGPPRWPEAPVAAAGATVSIEPTLAAFLAAVHEET